MIDLFFFTLFLLVRDIFRKCPLSYVLFLHLICFSFLRSSVRLLQIFSYLFDSIIYECYIVMLFYRTQLISQDAMWARTILKIDLKIRTIKPPYKVEAQLTKDFKLFQMPHFWIRNSMNYIFFTFSCV